MQDVTHPIEFSFATPTEIHCEGAGGLHFFLPFHPLFGVPVGMPAAPDEAHAA